MDVEVGVDSTSDNAGRFSSGHAHSEFRGSAHRIGVTLGPACSTKPDQHPSVTGHATFQPAAGSVRPTTFHRFKSDRTPERSRSY
jgi:hypothetical protein